MSQPSKFLAASPRARLAWALALAIGWPWLAIAAPAVVLTDVAIVDVDGGVLREPQTVLVVGDRIAAIGAAPEITVPTGAERIDGRGRYLMPGLVDMHVHLFNNASRRPPNDWSLPLYVAHGVTAVREMAALPESMAVVEAWRRGWADGQLVAPRVVAAGVVVWGPTPEAAQRQADQAADARADFIKVFSEIGESAWRGALAAAQRRGLPLMGHVPAGVSALAAARAGQKSEEHLMQVFEACSSGEEAMLDARRGLSGDALVALRDSQEPQALMNFDTLRCDKAAAGLAQTGVAQVPTLVLDATESQPYDKHPERDPRWKLLRADEQARWQRLMQDQPAADVASAARRREVARRIIGSLRRAGVPILAGTDAPMPGIYPGDALHQELALLVEAGLTPAQALRAATTEAARFLGRSDDFGRIALGQRADLVLLSGNPLADIRHTRRIEAVVLNGRLLRRDALDALLVEPRRLDASK